MTVTYGLDTNVLIFAHMPALVEHLPVSAFLGDLVRRDDTQLAVTPIVLHEFIHVISDPRRFEPPVAMTEATALARSYLNRTNVSCLAVTDEALALALTLVDQHRLGRKRIADTLLAATYIVHRVDALITCDPDDFAIIDGLRVIDPRLPQG
jgi:predicted nucleic acid-binding protein